MTKSATNVNKLIRNLTNKLTKMSASPNKTSSKRKTMRKSRRRVRVPPPQRGILAGYGSAVTSSFRIDRSADACIVTGYDLVTYTATSYNYISYFVPVNPIGWSGTRVAAIATGYQNYRPLSIKIHYRPQVGSTDTKSLFIGTIWQNNTINAIASIEPSLLTSSGGTYVPSWQSVSSVVPCGDRLPQRMYPIRDPESANVPFFLVARSSPDGPSGSAVAMPGRVFVEYTFRFNNAIGVTSGYSDWATATDTLQTLPTIDAAKVYTGTVCDSSAPNVVPIGSHLSWDRSYENNALVYYPELNGTDASFNSAVNVTVGRFGNVSY